MELNRDNLRKIRGLIVFTIVILVALWKYAVVFEVIGFLLHIVFPFLLGGAIAFVLNVPMNFLQRNLFAGPIGRGSRRAARLAKPVSLILTILFVFGVISLVMLVVIPELGTTIVGLGSNIQRFFPKLQEALENLFRNNPELQDWIAGLQLDWQGMINEFLGFFRTGAGNVVDSTFSVARSIIGGLTTFFIAFVFACYILLQKDKLNVQVRKVLYAYLPEKWVEETLSVCSLTYKTFSSFLAGQCLEAVILGTMFFLVMTAIGLPYPMLVGILIAFTALIPIFGAFIGCFVGAFLILMVDPMKALIFVIVFLVLQQIEGNLIYPKVVGNSVGLPSIWVLAAVSVGGSLMGVVGMLIFIPVISVLYTLFRESVYARLKEKHIKIPAGAADVPDRDAEGK